MGTEPRSTEGSFRADLRRLGELWRKAEKFQNGSPHAIDRKIGDRAHAEALALENELVARFAPGASEQPVPLWDFWNKHAMPPKVCPSCLVCGQPTPPDKAAITHIELPGIVVCDLCRDMARRPSAEPSGLQDMVPRSRYDAANKDWIEERDLRKKVSANAAEWIGLLSAALRKLVDITRDERKHLIPAALNEAAHALNWQPSDGVSPEPVAKPNPCRNECSLISLDDDHWKCNHCDAVFAYTGAQKPVEKPRCWWPLCKETAGDALCDAVQSALTKGEKP